MSSNYLTIPGAHPGDRHRFVFFDDTDATETLAARVKATDMLRDLDPLRRSVSIWTHCSRCGLEDVPVIGEESSRTELVNPKDTASGLTTRTALAVAALLRA